MDAAAGGYGAMIVVLMLVGLVVTALWLCVPFLIMCTNGRLDKILTQLAKLENPDSKTQVQCTECLSYVPKASRKCRHCTSALVHLSEPQSFPGR